ncbi:hypothetical protein ACJX0J_020722, partial [Zea mays]
LVTAEGEEGGDIEIQSNCCFGSQYEGMNLWKEQIVSGLISEYKSSLEAQTYSLERFHVVTERALTVGG